MPETTAPATSEAERRRLYGMTMPASRGETVCQGHADWCAEHGHATWTVDGEVQGTCPRCGELVGPAADVTAEQVTPCMELAGAEENSGWDDGDDGCEGHESLAGEHMGEAVYCDGSCRRPGRRPVAL